MKTLHKSTLWLILSRALIQEEASEASWDRKSPFLLQLRELLEAVDKDEKIQIK